MSYNHLPCPRVGNTESRSVNRSEHRQHKKQQQPSLLLALTLYLVRGASLRGPWTRRINLLPFLCLSRGRPRVTETLLRPQVSNKHVPDTNHPCQKRPVVVVHGHQSVQRCASVRCHSWSGPPGRSPNVQYSVLGISTLAWLCVNGTRVRILPQTLAWRGTRVRAFSRFT